MLISLLILSVCPSARAQAPAMRTVRPEMTDAPLLNPGMGIYLMVGRDTQPAPELWFMELADIAYHRCHWADLEPARGDYRFDEYLGPMWDFWVHRLGKRVALRVMCESMHARKAHVTPQWVFDAGVPAVTHEGLYVDEQVDPVFWDPLYLDLHCEFIRAFGEWANGREGLEFVDIGSIGEWGEMHFGQHIPGRWTSEQLAETGFTETNLALAYRRVIDAFADAFPHTRVFLNVGSREHINDYAAMRGLHFRQDGLGPNGASYNVESTLYPRYGFSGVQCNLELIVDYNTMQERGWDPVEVIRKGLEAPLSYQNINFGGTGFLADPPADVREAVELCARRIGYRFALRELTLPAQLHAWPDMPGRVPLQQVWENTGVAPCYESLAFEWDLVGSDGATVASVPALPDTPTTQWRPGEPVSTGALLQLPAGLEPGAYDLTVRMFLPEQPERTYDLPLPDAVASGRYRVAQVELTPGDAAAIASLRWDFEDAATEASAPTGMAAAIVDEPVHAGTGALRFGGHSQDTWNYGKIATVPLIPGAHYRLSAWLMIRELSDGASRPTMKVGVNGADGRWITNANTGPYDTERLGEWQHMRVEFDCSAMGATGDITVERSAFSESTEAELYVDDVELSVLAAP